MPVLDVERRRRCSAWNLPYQRFRSRVAMRSRPESLIRRSRSRSRRCCRLAGLVGEDDLGAVRARRSRRSRGTWCGRPGGGPAASRLVTRMIVISRAQLLEHVLDAHGGDRVDGDGELVEAEDLGLVREGAGDGEALLLAAGERGAEAVEAVLHLVPQRGLAQAALDDGVELGLAASCRRSAARRRRCRRCVSGRPTGSGATMPILRRSAKTSFDPRARPRRPPGSVPETVAAGGEVDRAVEAAQQRGLARLGGADDAEDLVAADVEGDAVEDLLRAVGEAQVLDLDLLDDGGHAVTTSSGRAARRAARWRWR